MLFNIQGRNYYKEGFLVHELHYYLIQYYLHNISRYNIFEYKTRVLHSNNYFNHEFFVQI